ncbi:hypothetical protein HYW20_07045 [Candidatus Woesearchaeota archaeon]|nr:hypothetical protein [Candidatus Woesearchaeota archaeon]
MDHKKTYRKVMRIIAGLEDKKGVTVILREKIRNAVRINDIINEANKIEGINKKDTLSMLQAARNSGDFYEIKKGIIKRI